MNTGIQDGYNLAWKIWLVLGGAAREKILETYNEERLENAENLLKTTDRFFNLVASPEPVLSYLRMHVFPLVAGAAFNLEAVKKFVFPRISQIAINYRHSSLSENEGDFSVKAGDRMPYFLINDKSIFDFLREPKFHFLVFSNDEKNFDELFGQIEKLHGDSIDCRTVPLPPHAAKIFRANDSFAVLLRPDNHVGFVSERISFDELKGYLFLNQIFDVV